MRHTMIYTSAILVTAFALVSCQDGQNDGFSRAFVLERLDQGIGGPKALARPGDILLENDKVRVTILGARTSMGPGLYGGVLIDADLQWNTPDTTGGHGRDQFAELDPTVNMNVAMPVDVDDVRIIEDGSDGGPAVVRVVGHAEPFMTLLGALWGLVGAPDFHLVTDYIAEPGVPWIRIRTTAIVDWDGEGELPIEGEPVDYFDDGLPVLDWAVESGLVLGEFYLSGGSVDVFAPDLGFDEDSAVYESWKEGRNTFLDPYQFEYLAGVGDGVSYGLAPVQGDLYIPLFTSGQTAAFGGGKAGDGTSQRFPAGSAWTYERYFFIGHGDVASIVDAYLEARDIPAGRVSGHVVEAATGLPLSHVNVFAYRPGAEQPWSEFTTDVDPRDERADGAFSGMLPVGEWELLAHVYGRPDSERVAVTVTEGGEVETGFVLERPGTVSLFVRDEADQPLPSKVTVYRLDDEPWRNSDLGDGYQSGDPEDTLFSADGTFVTHLPPGEYRAVASRGPEYELGVQDFTVEGVDSVRVDLSVRRTVDTSGWVATDFHNHSDASHDSGLISKDRVTCMAAEGVDFFNSSDHDYIRDHRPTVEDLGIERWVQTVPGVEVTTLEIGHFNGWPLAVDTLADAGGAPDWTGLTPEDIIDELDALGEAAGYEPLLIANHARAGVFGYFSQFGFDPYAGTPGLGGEPGSPVVTTPLLSYTNPILKDPGNFTLDFDAMEVFNGKSLRYVRTPTQSELDRYAAGEAVTAYDLIYRSPDEQQALIDGTDGFGYGHMGLMEDWFTLLNLGYRITAVGNSDSHGATSIEAGTPRNYVVSETDDPAFIEPQALVDAVKAHRVVVSYGPFVQLWVDDAPVGSEIEASGEVTARVQVQAPSWMDVDVVQLYENGTLIHEWEVEGDDVLRFDEELALTPAEDAWYVAMAMGDGDLAPVTSPVDIPAIELQEIITQALGGVEAVAPMLSKSVPIPLEHPMYPFGFTNPVWVDTDGGGFDAPGLPAWWKAPVEPVE